MYIKACCLLFRTFSYSAIYNYYYTNFAVCQGLGQNPYTHNNHTCVKYSCMRHLHHIIHICYGMLYDIQ